MYVRINVYKKLLISSTSPVQDIFLFLEIVFVILSQMQSPAFSQEKQWRVPFSLRSHQLIISKICITISSGPFGVSCKPFLHVWRQKALRSSRTPRRNVQKLSPSPLPNSAASANGFSLKFLEMHIHCFLILPIQVQERCLLPLTISKQGAFTWEKLFSPNWLWKVHVRETSLRRTSLVAMLKVHEYSDCFDHSKCLCDCLKWEKVVRNILHFAKRMQAVCSFHWNVV